jgi:septation ring formation regulator EzrA
MSDYTDKMREELKTLRRCHDNDYLIGLCGTFLNVIEHKDDQIRDAHRILLIQKDQLKSVDEKLKVLVDIFPPQAG